MTFNYKKTNSLEFSTKVKIGDSVLENDSGIFGRSVLWIFYCRNGSTNGYWTQTKYTSIMNKNEIVDERCTTLECYFYAFR